MRISIRTCCSVVVLGALLLSCVGCSRPTGEIFADLDEPLVWPEPPQQGRLRYVGMISTEDDLKRGASWSKGLGELLFGREKIGAMMAPSAVVFAAGERMYVADGAGGVMHMFDLAEREYKQFSSIGGAATLIMPVAVAVIDDSLYVADSVLAEVLVFDATGNYRSRFGNEHLVRPSSIAYYGPADRLYVSDTGGHVIKVFNKQGRFVETIGSRGTEPGQFNFQTHICVDGQGRLYVSDTLNYRVQVFSADGQFLKTFGEHGDGPGYFAHPAGIATDSFGNIHVVDRQYENIQIFDSEGVILMAFGREGRDAGEFWLPAGMCIDDRNRIYVADSFNKRVQVFELIGGER